MALVVSLVIDEAGMGTLTVPLAWYEAFEQRYERYPRHESTEYLAYTSACAMAKRATVRDAIAFAERETLRRPEVGVAVLQFKGWETTEAYEAEVRAWLRAGVQLSEIGGGDGRAGGGA